jgi:hypothetical protein
LVSTSQEKRSDVHDFGIESRNGLEGGLETGLVAGFSSSGLNGAVPVWKPVLQRTIGMHSARAIYCSTRNPSSWRPALANKMARIALDDHGQRRSKSRTRWGLGFPLRSARG